MITFFDKFINAKFLVYIFIVKVFLVVIVNDGIVLKAGFRFDERIKRVVGLNVDVDLKFALDNFELILEFLK